jgi:glyoxylase-like metal-dependent hydrolase (beta-lactamase superfamily II)/rhodanese-related sulfurtransferase
MDLVEAAGIAPRAGRSPATGPLTTGLLPAKGELKVVTYEAAGLGDRSYLVHDGRAAAVIDPQRDPAPYVATADDLGLDITAVLETHIHNDYVSGGLALARRTGASYGIPAGETVSFGTECEALAEGDQLSVGELTIKVLYTPGHTPHHLSYLVESAPGARVVLTGGSLLAGATGRTDLFGQDESPRLAEAQWRSVRRLLEQLPPETTVLPTHGFGSFCSAGPEAAGLATAASIETERQRNPASVLELAAFVESLVLDPPPIPAYYVHIAPLNRAGPREPSYGPVPRVAPASLPALLQSGTAIVDLRQRRSFAADHWPGALNMEVGPSLTTYLGWLVPVTAPVVVISQSVEDTLEACHLLARIGREALAGWVAADDVLALIEADERAQYPVAGFHDLAARSKQGARPTVVDVRFPHEWRTGHIRGARNVPVPEFGAFSLTLPATPDEIWVHCAAGYRAAIAASLLSSQGLRPVLVDDIFDNAVAAGLEIVPPASAL